MIDIYSVVLPGTQYDAKRFLWMLRFFHSSLLLLAPLIAAGFVTSRARRVCHCVIFSFLGFLLSLPLCANTKKLYANLTTTEYDSFFSPKAIPSYFSLSYADVVSSSRCSISCSFCVLSSDLVYAFRRV